MAKYRSIYRLQRDSASELSPAGPALRYQLQVHLKTKYKGIEARRHKVYMATSGFIAILLRLSFAPSYPGSSVPWFIISTYSV